MDNAELAARLARAEQRIELVTQVLDDIIAKNLPIDLVLSDASEDRSAQAAPLEIVFDDNFGHGNFYKSEVSENKRFRWMGPYAETHMVIYRARNVAYQLTLDAPFNVHGEGFLANMVLTADGAPLEWTKEQQSVGHLISAIIPAVEGTTLMPAFVLGIIFPQVIAFSGGDDRSATIGLSRLTLTPIR